MFSYYGSKSKIINLYPRPRHKKIIEPFAGSARYALKYFDRDVLLVDAYPVIVDLWKWLQKASEKDILGLPDVNQGDDIREMGLSTEEKYLIGFCINGGSQKPKNIGTDNITRNFNSWNKDKFRIAKSLYKIRHWEIRLGSYEQIENDEATWFIDPPYQFQNLYVHNDIDYKYLAKWCTERNGQVIVCENDKADWLSFQPLRAIQGQRKISKEYIWCNESTVLQNALF